MTFTLPQEFRIGFLDICGQYLEFMRSIWNESTYIYYVNWYYIYHSLGKSYTFRDLCLYVCKHRPAQNFADDSRASGSLAPGSPLQAIFTSLLHYREENYTSQTLPSVFTGHRSSVLAAAARTDAEIEHSHSDHGTGWKWRHFDQILPG